MPSLQTESFLHDMTHPQPPPLAADNTTWAPYLQIFRQNAFSSDWLFHTSLIHSHHHSLVMMPHSWMRLTSTILLILPTECLLLSLGVWGCVWLPRMHARASLVYVPVCVCVCVCACVRMRVCLFACAPPALHGRLSLPSLSLSLSLSLLHH